MCCPGFGRDRANFLSSSWCSAVFWIWDENSVDNILIFLGVARQSRTFQLLMLPGAWETGTGHSWDSGPKLAKRDIPYHMILCSVPKAGENVQSYGICLPK